MTDDKDKREGQPGIAAKSLNKDPRQHRLKLALRENLKRRKSQARGRSDIGAASSNRDAAAPYDESGKKPAE
jgi:hypothetical protein